MHQGKRFIRTWRHELPDGHVPHLFASCTLTSYVGAGWKRSRHRTRADRYGLRESSISSGGPHPKHTVPKWFRQQRNRKYRAVCQDLMRRSRYDDLPPHYRDAAWNYW